MSGAHAGFVVAIPARYASTRLPGKPLRDIGGRPMIAHVAARALEAGAASVVVATDDARIADAVAALDVAVCMTDPALPSGTDRLAVAADALRWPDDTVVVNLQGDEPLAPPSGIRAVAATLVDADTPMATLATALDEAALLFDPNCVKVVRAQDGRALYFSRAPVPWHRDAFAQSRDALPADGGWLRHIGIYAYRAGFLRRFRALPVGRLERVESLEQLRVLEAGIDIAVGLAPEPFPPGVDTEHDLARAKRLLVARG